jgi:hypothetical protein
VAGGCSIGIPGLDVRSTGHVGFNAHVGQNGARGDDWESVRIPGFGRWAGLGWSIDRWVVDLELGQSLRSRVVGLKEMGAVLGQAN